eukprot:GDKJ01005342.1.p1 GENE.GDKJ01005342.1~~GDKJ01005342.1.p1  ORF type:complete len:379 (-),score=71.70 GDKJ01005342.1:35-1171(-)
MSIFHEFSEFQKTFALRRISLPHEKGLFTYYRFGNASNDVILMLPGMMGSSSVFFHLIKELTDRGYEVIAAAFSDADTIKDWVYALDLFLDAVSVETVHLFGYGLGGYLGSHYALTYPKRVKSLILLNSFASTRHFISDALITPSLVSSFMPHFALANMITAGLPTGKTQNEKDIIKFIRSTLDELSRSDLAARMSISGVESSLPTPLPSTIPTTVISSVNSNANPQSAASEMNIFFPAAKKVSISPSPVEMPPITNCDELIAIIVTHLNMQGLLGRIQSPNSSPSRPKQRRGSHGGGESESHEIVTPFFQRSNITNLLSSAPQNSATTSQSANNLRSNSSSNIIPSPSHLGAGVSQQNSFSRQQQSRHFGHDSWGDL